jgi:hypothetical protein
MKRAYLVIGLLVAGAVLGPATTLTIQHLRHEDEVLRGLAYGGSSQPKAEVGKPYTFDGGSVCVTGDVGRITSIRPRHTQGGLLTVTDFDLVDDLMTDRPTDVVTTRCKANSDAGQRLFVTLTADQLPAATDGYVIEYTIDGRKATTTSKNWAILCDSTKKPDVVYGDISRCYE